MMGPGTRTHRRDSSSSSYIIYLILLIFVFIRSALSKDDPSSDLPHQLWLISPPARQLERNAPASQRLPETMCPTPKSANDSTSSVPSGEPFRVRWRDPDGIPVEAAKFELFSANSGHLLARLETADGHSDPGNQSALVSVRIPDGLRCDACVLRLSMELDERIQLLSCADVRVVPQAAENTASGGEYAEDGECGGTTRGQCVQGQCYCRRGFHGLNCGKESAGLDTFSLPKLPEAQSVRFPVTGSEFLWQADPERNILEMGLRLKRAEKDAPSWFILGIQSTEADPKCQLAMDQWKRKSIPLAPSIDDSHAKANAGVLLRLEQRVGENSLAPGAGMVPSPVPDSNSSGLHIRKLEGGKEVLELSRGNVSSSPEANKKCGPNEHFERCPESGRECEPSCDWTAFPESIPSCAPRGETCGQARCVCDEGFVRLSNRRDECKPFNFCQAPEVLPFSASDIPSALSSSALPLSTTIGPSGHCAVNETWEKCGRACEPSCASMYSEEPCGERCEIPGCTCDDNFVRSANGKCIAWTDCPNLKERIAPRRGISSSSNSTTAPSTESDAVLGTTKVAQIAESVDAPAQCGANETINECGRVCETDCVSIFDREECHECATSACACKQGYTRNNGKCVYWGDCPTVNGDGGSLLRSGSTSSNSIESSIERSSSSSSPPISSLSSDEEEPPMDLCLGQWAWPVGCAGAKCLYRLAWNFDEKLDSVVFTLDTRPAAAKKAPKGTPIWSGVGFSPSGTLLDADMVVLEAGEGEGSKLEARDMHVNEDIEQLRLDRQQDIRGEGQFVNGAIKAKFWRKLRTDDGAGEDLDFVAEQCFRFLFPVAGGRFERSGNVSRVPVADSLYASDAEVCMRKKCGKEGKETAAKTPGKESPSGEKDGKGITDDGADAASCEREFRWPEKCKDNECEYRARWAWNAAGDDVQFNISAKGIGRWTGIGFSRDGRMAGSDIVTGWVYDQKAYLTDRFAHAQQLPAIDPADRQDIFDIGGSVEDDIQTISFRRRVLSADRATDLPLTASDHDQCPFFLFPVAGGRVLARSTRDFQNSRTPIGFHDQRQPERSAKRVCQCERAEKEKGGGDKRVGRARREAEMEEKKGGTGPPYQCADIAIFQVVPDGDAVRVVDAFALSNDSLFRDEQWGGRQSFVDVSVEREGRGESNDKMMAIWMRKLIKDSDNDNADLAIGKGATPVFLASGHGVAPDMGTVQRLEFAMVDLMAGMAPQTAAPTTMWTTTTTLLTTSSTSSTSSAPSSPSSTSSETKNTDQPEKVITSTETATEADDNEAPADFEHANMEDRGEETGHNIGDEMASTAPPVMTDGEAESAESVPPPAVAAKLPILPPAVLMDENCYGGFAYPEQCMDSEAESEADSSPSTPCGYMLEWRVQPAEQRVHFRLSTRMALQSWTGVGFSTDGSMMNADAIVVLLSADGRVSLSDQFAPGYGRPAIDRLQNVDMAASSSAYSDGVLFVNFSRPLFTGDTAQDADLRECHHFLFLHSGGPLAGRGAEIRKHTETPIRSGNKICLAKCGQQSAGAAEVSEAPLPGTAHTFAPQTETTIMSTMAPETTTKERATTTQSQTRTRTSSETTRTTTTSTETKTTTATEAEEEEEVKIAGGKSGGGEKKQHEEGTLFNVAVRLTNERWDARLEEPDTEQFRALAKRLAGSLRTLIGTRWPSLAEIRVQKFAEGSVLALLQLRFVGPEAPSEEELKDYLQESAAQGTAEELIWDRDMLEVKRDGGQEDEDNKWSPLREMQGWVLASVLLLLLLCTISGLLFCAFRSRRRRRTMRRTFPTKHSPYSNGFPHHRPQYAPFNGNGGCDRDSDTTAKTNTTSRGGGGGAPEGAGAQQTPAGVPKMGQNGRIMAETPKGIGEATYREWFTKVASKDAPSHYQETGPPTPLARRSSGSASGVPPSPLQSYVSYPNDPSFYTLNGEHRIVPPPPAYYRPPY